MDGSGHLSLVIRFSVARQHSPPATSAKTFDRPEAELFLDCVFHAACCALYHVYSTALLLIRSCATVVVSPPTVPPRTVRLSPQKLWSLAAPHRRCYVLFGARAAERRCLLTDTTMRLQLRFILITYCILSAILVVCYFCHHTVFDYVVMLSHRLN